MKKIILILILLTSGFLFAQKTDSLKIEQIYQKIDSIKYSESDFIKMQKYYTENSELNKLISDKASNGNKDAIDFLELLTLSYKNATEKHGESDIKAMIYSYYMTVEMQEKFKKINSDLDSQIDSLELKREYLKKNIEEYIKEIDSLKNK